MNLSLSEYCCDAISYIESGFRCALEGNCFDSLRPLGTVLYFAVPGLFGADKHALVLLNLAVILASVLVSAIAAKAFFPKLNSVPLAWLKAVLLSALAHGVFLAGTAFIPSSDLPSACAGLMGIWFFAIACSRRSPVAFAASGFFFGTAAFIRAFYLYPVMLLAGLTCLYMLFRRLKAAEGVAFVLFLLFPVSLQFAATYRNTGRWQYLPTTVVGPVIAQHLGSSYIGYDTHVVDGQFKNVPYEGASCLAVRDGGVEGAWKRSDYKGLGKLFLKRQNYYFGSYINRPYPVKRYFSVFILASSFLAMLLALGTYFGRGKDRGFLMPLAFVGSVWAIATVICPESRFVMVIQVLIWVLALFWALSRFGRPAQPVVQVNG